MNQYFFTVETNDYPIDLNFEAIIQTTLTQIDAEENSELTIVFIDNDYMQALNTQYRGYAQPTDVLSFESGEKDLESGNLYLGDILISYPYVQQQALQLNNTLADELTLMIIHGILHLCGYDHDTPQRKQAMWQVQSKILDLLAIHLNKLPE